MVSNISSNNNGMDENADTEDEKLLILPLNDKNSEKISQIISNDTARNVLELSHQNHFQHPRLWKNSVFL